MFYREEFLDYLNKYGNGYYEIFDVETSPYSNFENQLITDVIGIMEPFLMKVSEARGVNPVVNVYCVKDDTVNAFCFMTNGNYYIGIHSGTFANLIRRTEILAENLLKYDKWGFYKNKSVEDLQAFLWTNAFKIILLHEYMHIILGHCDTVCEKTAFLWEMSPDTGEEAEGYSNKEMQAMEFFADQFSVKDCVWQIMYKTKENVSEIKYEVLNLYLAILLFFSMFYNCDDSYSCHPKLGVRFHYLISTVDDTFYNGLNVSNIEEVVEEIDSVIDVFMELIVSLPSLFEIGIVQDLAVENIDRMYMELYNIASDVVKETNRKALYPINEFAKVDESILGLLKNERDILKEAFQTGKTYEETKEVLRQCKNNMYE